MATSVRLKSVLVLALSGLSIYLGVLNLVDRIRWKQPWEGIGWTQTAQGVEASLIFDSWASGPQAGLASGDVLVSLSGIPIQTLDEYTEVIEALWQTLPPGGQVTYLVKKAGTNIEAHHPVEIQLRSNLDRGDIFLIIVAFTYLGIGLLIYLRSGNVLGSFHFYLICLVSFVLYLYRYSGRADTFDLLIYWFSALAFLLLPPLFLHFCCYFPEPLSCFRRWPRSRAILYVPFIFLLGLHALWFSGRLAAAGLARNHVLERFFNNVHLTFFIAFFLLGAFALVFARREAASAVQRQQMKWVTHGTLIGILPFTCLYALPYLLGWNIYASMEASILGLALIPLAFGYAITRYRLMDVELIFKKSAAYVLASSALLGLYIGIVLLITRAIQGFSSTEWGFTPFALIALGVALLFSPLKDRIQEQIDRFFYKERYDYRRSFAEFGRTLSSEISLQKLTEKISNRIQQTLNLAPVVIFLRDDSETERYQVVRFLSHASRARVGDPPTELRIPDATFSDLERTQGFPDSPAPRKEVDGARHRLARWGIHYVYPLKVRDRRIGFIGLGKRLNGDFLSSEDLDIISALSDYAAIAIDNAILYRSLEMKANELAQLKVYSDNVVESISVGVVVVNPQGEISTWNSSMESLYGLTQNQVVEKNVAEVFPTDLVKTMKKIVDGPRWIIEETGHLYKTYLEARKQDGSRESKMVNIVFSPFVSRDDVITGTLLVFDDITEKVQLENQLLQAEKLTSIGLFAAGVAHEVNTPLAGISSYAQMLLKETPPDSSQHEGLKKIEQQTFRASNIINNLLNFARVTDSELHELNMNSLMVETLSLLDHQFKKGSIEVRMRLDPAIPKTLGSVSKLQQVFMNLFLNAKDAMPQGGQLEVKTYEKNSALMVEIRDNGVGIPEDNIKKIYDPFFTTKEVGKGTGLGLSVSYGIIQEYSGRISVESEPGSGTIFKLSFPIRRVN